MKGHPTICKHFDRKVEAEDEAKKIETQINEGKYVSNKAKEKTLAELIDLSIPDAVLGHHKAAKDTVFQLNYFRERLGSYALIYITPELLLQECKRLLELPTYRNALRNPATINRYFATLGGAFRYACANSSLLGSFFHCSTYQKICHHIFLPCAQLYDTIHSTSL